PRRGALLGARRLGGRPERGARRAASLGPGGAGPRSQGFGQDPPRPRRAVARARAGARRAPARGGRGRDPRSSAGRIALARSSRSPPRRSYVLARARRALAPRGG